MNLEVKPVRLFERLQDFYLRWCDGEFIDVPPEKENLPQFKKEQLKKRLPEQPTHLGLRQVDVYTGLNTIILLLELHRYAQTKDELKDKIRFHLCGQLNTEEFDSQRLLRIIGYSQCLGISAFTRILGVFLSDADLSGANLSRANLSLTNLDQKALAAAYLCDTTLPDGTVEKRDCDKNFDEWKRQLTLKSSS